MPLARPELANKVPTDLGTKSIAEVNAELDKIKGPRATGGYIKPDDFSSLTNEERAKIVAKGRELVHDRFETLKVVARNLILIQISLRAVRWMGSKFLDDPQAKWFARALVTAFVINRWRAWPRLSPKETHKNMPEVYPIVGGLPIFIVHTHDMHDFLLETTRQSKFETFEIPVPMNCFVGLMDARDREYVLKTNPWNYPKNRENDPACFERLFAEVLGRGIFATDGSEWFTARKIASHMFSGTALRSQMEHVFNHHADRVVHLLTTTAVGKTIDIQDVFQAAVFDAFCEIAFGAFPNATDSAIGGVKPQFLVSFDLAQQIMSERIMMPPPAWNVARVFGMITGAGVEGEFVEHVKLIDDYIYSIVDERLNEKDIGERNDLLSLYIQYSRSQKEQFTREDYRDIIANFMVAGRDTTSCTLTYTTKFLGENPEVLKRLEEEGLFELGKTTASTRSIGWEESKAIPYADAVVNEVLRMAPPVGNDFRVCAHDDMLPSGLKVREGSRIVLLNQAIGRDPFLWKDADEFIPDRWMKYDSQGIPQPLRRVDEYVHPIFFAGRRLCLGKDMARFESIVFMSKIFEKLKLEPLVPKQVATVTGPVIFIKGGLPCKVSLRQ